MKKEFITDNIIINSGDTLLRYLNYHKINIVKCTALESANNCIYLPDKTSFNWKARNGEVRINCKEETKNIIEQKSELHMIKNGVGDSVRDYSILLDDVKDLEIVIKILKTIEGNIAK